MWNDLAVGVLKEKLQMLEEERAKLLIEIDPKIVELKYAIREYML